MDFELFPGSTELGFVSCLFCTDDHLRKFLTIFKKFLTIFETRTKTHP
jgi:hypothetical protein